MIKKRGILIISILTAFLYVGVVSAMISDSTPPTSHVNYFTNKDELSDKKQCLFEDNSKKAYLNYNDVVGHGISNDTTSPIIEINVRLDNTAQELAICDDISCNDMDKSENWHTRTHFNLEEGWHNLSVKAKDSLNNEEAFNNNNFCMFCIDKQKPNAPSKPVLSRESFCDPNYINSDEEDVIFAWIVQDNGCAGVSFFDVFVELDFNKDGIADEAETFTEIEESMINLNEFSVLENGDAVRIRIRANDKAVNVGDWSEFSNWFFIDTLEPKVNITNTNADEWIMGNLEITETDEDANQFKCFYKVHNNGTLTVDWTETPCNQPFSIDTVQVCPLDGKNKCIVFKKAQDKACNEEIKSKQFDIDNHAPELIKIIGKPNYLDGKFLSTRTPITLKATDDASGVKQLCYKINNKAPVCISANNDTTFLLTTTFNFLEESQHNLTFWAIDNLGHKKEISQIHFVDNTPPITKKIYSILFQKLGEFTGKNFRIENFLIDFISPNTRIILNASDPIPHPSGINKTLFKIMSRYDDTDEETHSEWFGLNDKKWYDALEACKEKNEETNCIEVSGWTNTLLQTYVSPISIQDEGVHKICFKSVDNVDNEEMQMCQVFFVDTTAPSIQILNPTFAERNIEKCAQSIVALVNDAGSGIKRVWAELLNATNYKVREVKMSRTIYGTYEALMDKQLPSDNYTLKVNAEDNVGNIKILTLEEQLVKTVFVEFISPAICSINAAQGGTCKFTFNICMRDANSISFWLNKLGGLVTPAMMNATISKDSNSTFVGLSNSTFFSDVGRLKLSNGIINGRTTFNLDLNIPANLASTIGKGAHSLEYWINSYVR